MNVCPGSQRNALPVLRQDLLDFCLLGTYVSSSCCAMYHMLAHLIHLLEVVRACCLAAQTGCYPMCILFVRVM